MSYNTILQSNNSDLQTILDKVNNLPEGSNSEPKLQDKTITPSTSEQTVNADDGYDGLNPVTVNAMPTTSQATPSITVDDNGLITAKAIQSAGYVNTGTKSATKQLAFQPAKTITPTKSVQTAVSSGYYTGGDIKVAAIPDTYVQPSGTLSITVNGTHNVKNYASVNVNVAGGNTDIEDALITRNLTTYENSRLTYIGSHAFAYCSTLTSVNFPACKTVGASAFYNCKSLITVTLPMCESISQSIFKVTPVLKTINLPACKTIGDYTFTRQGIKTLSLPMCGHIGYYAFQSCWFLTELILTNSSVCTLQHSAAFVSTPFTNYSDLTSLTPHIYVPQSLLASYKSATNWAYFSSYFSAIENRSNIIPFFIDNVEYQAEDGMTWAEWCNSQYNTDGFYMGDDGVVYTKNGDEFKLETNGETIGGGDTEYLGSFLAETINYGDRYEIADIW